MQNTNEIDIRFFLGMNMFITLLFSYFLSIRMINMINKNESFFFMA